MPHHAQLRSSLCHLGLALTVLSAVGLQGCASTPSHTTEPASVANNFGLPTGFSVKKMDLTADPRKDFPRFAAGTWLDAAKISGDMPRISAFDVMTKQTQTKVKDLISDAAKISPTAAKGSVLQQVGDFYASGMDEARLTQLGVQPLQPYMDQLTTSTSKAAQAKTLADLAVMTNDQFVFGAAIGTDINDRNQYAIYFSDSDLSIAIDNYLKPENKNIRAAYKQLIVDYMMLAGDSLNEAQAIADTVLDIEMRIASHKMTPVQRRDPNKRFVKMQFAELKALLPNFDLDTYFKTLGLPNDREVIVMELDSLRERNAILARYQGKPLQNYLRWELLRRTANYLSPEFEKPLQAFSDVLNGKTDALPRAERVANMVPTKLGHPVSKLYVDQYFPAANKVAVEEIIGRIKAEYRSRMVNNTWLTPQTRQNALAKLDKIELRVAYPSQWIDYSSVEIRRDDYLGNVLRLNRFSVERNLSKLNQAITFDEFASAGQTLPIDINAAYDPSRNGIEIPAAFLQAPVYDAKADPAINFCTVGAVIGHELTHGFDSGGRFYDGNGNVRNWWADDDVKNFKAKTEKLVKQANDFLIPPDIRMNGQLAVGENLADVGGLAMGYGALKTYLKTHPAADKKIDGLTQDQRCFLAWSQVWATKAKPEWLKQVLSTDPHSPGEYRMIAPAQHEANFYRAFGIQAGDAMWLNEAARADIW